MITRAMSGIRKPKPFLSFDKNIVSLEPASFKQASKDSKWQEATTKEYNPLLANETYELVSPQPGQTLVGCRRVYGVKI